ncbi:MAG: hypothetical protein U0271_46485 [Polyangiaceae bacterium]
MRGGALDPVSSMNPVEGSKHQPAQVPARDASMPKLSLNALAPAKPVKVFAAVPVTTTPKAPARARKQRATASKPGTKRSRSTID